MRRSHFFLAFVLAAAVLEAGARFAQPWLARSTPAYYFRPFLALLTEEDSTLVWNGRPNAVVELPNSQGEKITYQLNSQGWRDKEFAPFARPLNALVLGDSFAFGLGVAAADRFTDRIERAIPGLNLWNLGQMGYAPDQYMLLGQRWLTALPWSFLLIQLSNNDVADVAGHRWQRINSASGIPAVIEPPAAYALVSGFSEAWNLLVYFGLLEGRGFSESRLREGLERLLFSLKQNLLLAKERNVPVVFLQATDWGEPAYGAAIAGTYRDSVGALAKEFGVPLLEAGVGAEQLLPYPDLHWNSAGHEKVAALLLNKLWKPAPVEKLEPKAHSRKRR